ncbi:MAG: TlpA family protein disulfide reductase [Candidatus Dormibacteraeota bacterium]|nr:TlpA family protein disulfide reductase [Candidatus Dormibacteraeota bacterium]
MRARIRLLLALLVTLAAAATALVILPRGQASCGSCPATRTAATSWVLPSLSGSGTVSLAQFRGHPVVVAFFASWCTACRDELPAFLSESRAFPAVRFVGVDSEEYGDGLAMARQLGVTVWPLARDVGGTDGDALHQALTAEQGMPISALYRADGTLAQVRVGAETGDELATSLWQLFGLRPS